MPAINLEEPQQVQADGLFKDALFMLQVRPKDENETPNDSESTVFADMMPAHSVVVQDSRGGMAAKRPSRVQLLCKKGVSIALFSHTLLAERVVDAFIAERDRYIHDPRDRAHALRALLKQYNDEGHAFSLACFDESARAFFAWTPRSAPLSFGHAEDGSVVVVAATPRARTLVGKHAGVHLAHLPAGRFVYGHSYLKPFEFTQLWASASGNRSGAATQVALPPSVPAVDEVNLDKPKLSPAESKRWRWEKTGSRAEQSNSWTTAKVAKEEVVAVEEKETAAARIAAIAQAVAAQAESSASSTFKADAQPFVPTTKAPVSNPWAIETFAWGAWARVAFAKGLARVNRFETHANKRFMTLLLLRQALFTDVSARMEDLHKAEMSAAMESEECAVAVDSAGFIAPAALKPLSSMVHATAKLAAKAPKRKSFLQSWRIVPVPAMRAKANVVVCDINGTCCIGNECFVSF